MLSEKIRSVVQNIFTKYELIESPNIDIVELILLTHPECPSCIELKKNISFSLENGQIREVSVLEPEGKEIAKRFGYVYPSLFAKTSTGELLPCNFWFDGDDFVFDVDLNQKNNHLEIIATNVKEGSEAIVCLDPIIKNNLASLLLDLYGKHDDWWYNNIVPFLMSLPPCQGYSVVGWGKVKSRGKKGRKKRYGIVKLCKEAKNFLAKYDEKVRNLPECKLIEFAEVVSEGDFAKRNNQYTEFMSKCLKEETGPMQQRFPKCIEKWRELKSKSS